MTKFTCSFYSSLWLSSNVSNGLTIFMYKTHMTFCPFSLPCYWKKKMCFCVLLLVLLSYNSAFTMWLGLKLLKMKCHFNVVHFLFQSCSTKIIYIYIWYLYFNSGQIFLRQTSNPLSWGVFTTTFIVSILKFAYCLSVYIRE